MKKLFSLIGGIWLVLSCSVFGQFTFESWTDSIPISPTDTLVTASLTKYHTLIIVSDTVDILIKWNKAQTYFRVPAGGVMSFGPEDKISTLRIKTTAGVGVLYTAGTKAGKTQTSAKNF